MEKMVKIQLHKKVNESSDTPGINFKGVGKIFGV